MNAKLPAAAVFVSICSLALLVPAARADRDHDVADSSAKFKMMDTDGDGRISRAEHAAGAQKMFGRMDANGDGIVTAEEMEQGGGKPGLAHGNSARADTPDSMQPDSGSSITSAARSGGHAGHHHEMLASEKIKKIKVIDADGDGRITAAEHAAGSERMFARMDTNGDGFLSKDELNAGHKMMEKDE